MREDVQTLINALVHGIAQDEAMADKFDRIVDEHEHSTDIDFQTAFRSLSRMHRVKAIESRARLMGVVDQFGHLFPAKPSQGS